MGPFDDGSPPATVRRLALHWRILIGILLGAVLGGLIHRQSYGPLTREAEREALTEARARRLRALEAAREPSAAARDARRRELEAWTTLTAEQRRGLGGTIEQTRRRLFRQTLVGGLVDGVGRIFLALLNMVVIPLVFASLVTGVASVGDARRLGRMGGRTLAWYLATSVAAILTGLALVNLVRPGAGLRPPAMVHAEAPALPDSFWDVLVRMAPSNPFAAAAQFEIFPLIVFALLFGFFTLKASERAREAILGFFNGVFEIMMRMTDFVISLAPVGIAALVAGLVSLTGPEVFLGLLGYAGVVAAGLAVHFFVTLPLLQWLLTRRNPFRVMRQMSPALLTAFSTASSSATLPLTMELAENVVGVPRRVTGFVLPLGATVNMDGTALYECVATLFVAQMYATAHPEFTLPLAKQLLIVFLALSVSVGAAGIPHAGLVMMVIIFKAVGLPVELTALLWAVDRPLDMCRTAVNVWSDSSVCVVVGDAARAADGT